MEFVLYIAYEYPMNMSRVLGFVFGGNRGLTSLNSIPTESRPVYPDFKGNQFET